MHAAVLKASLASPRPAKRFDGDHIFDVSRLWPGAFVIIFRSAKRFAERIWK